MLIDSKHPIIQFGFQASQVVQAVLLWPTGSEKPTCGVHPLVIQQVFYLSIYFDYLPTIDVAMNYMRAIQTLNAVYSKCVR